MKKLGDSENGVIVELSQGEYRSLVAIGGIEPFADLFHEVNMEKVLARLASTRLGRIIDILRDVADRIETEEKKE